MVISFRVKVLCHFVLVLVEDTFRLQSLKLFSILAPPHLMHLNLVCQRTFGKSFVEHFCAHSESSILISHSIELMHLQGSRFDYFSLLPNT